MERGCSKRLPST